MLYQEKNITLKISNVLGSKVHTVVSKTVSKNATTRNLLKRRLREAIKSSLGKVNQKKVLFFYTKNGASVYSYKKIKEEVESLVKKSGLSKN